MVFLKLCYLLARIYRSNVSQTKITTSIYFFESITKPSWLALKYICYSLRLEFIFFGHQYELHNISNSETQNNMLNKNENVKYSK